MKFGPVPVAKAKGKILAHSLPVEKGRIRKGCILDPEDLQRLAKAGHETVVVAQLESSDVPEDIAAAGIANALVPDPERAGLKLAKPNTGRVNIYADAVGVIDVNVDAVNALNRIDPMITVATLPPFHAITAQRKKTLVATVKIISYAVDLESVKMSSFAGANALVLRPVVLQSARLVVTKHSESDKNGSHQAIIQRLETLNMTCSVDVVGHDEAAIAASILATTEDLVLVLTASATSDLHDVAPNAVRLAGGQVTRFGMPVDPGNLLFLGQVSDRPVIGLPGCARSSALNGADWVLERVVCGIDVSDDDIAAMGVGGLLKESPARPHPREKS